MKSPHVTVEYEDRILDMVGGLKAIQLSDDENEQQTVRKSAEDEGDDDDLSGQREDPTFSKRSSPDKGLRRSSGETQ